ncbi:hypothetical protein GCM10027447_03280 [Glycomyces halotolerans]
MVIGAAAFANDVFDLADTVSEVGAEEPSIDAIYRTAHPSESTGAEPDGPSADGPSSAAPEAEGAGLAQPPSCSGPSGAGSGGDESGTLGPAIDYDSEVSGMPVHPEVVDADPIAMSAASLTYVGGYTTGPVDLMMVVTNPTDQMMTVFGVAVDVERHQVPSGTIWTEVGGGGLGHGTGIVSLSFDLSEEEPEATTMENGCVLSDLYFESQQIPIEPGANELIKVRLWPGACRCLVRTVIQYAHAGKWATLTVPGPSEDPVTVVGFAEDGYQLVYHDTGFGVVKYDCQTLVHEYCAGAN